jgi:hypothetical protein
MTTETSLNRRVTKTLAKKITHIEKLDKPSSLKELHAAVFNVDLRVQRELNEKRSDEMAADFRPDSMGLITASKRPDGRLYILDGAHRVSAARKAMYDGLLATRVFEDLTLQEEAGLFLKLNDTKRIQAIDRFKVEVTMGDRQAVNINNILKAYDLHVDWSAAANPKSISAIVTLKRLYRGAGVWDDGEYADLVDATVKTITKSWPGETRDGVFSRAVLEGVGIFHATYGKKIELERLYKVVGNVPARQLVSRARTRRDATGGTIGENAAEIILDLYNNRQKDKLPSFEKAEPKNVMSARDRLEVDPNQYVQPELAHA